jgi:hypothetical protein
MAAMVSSASKATRASKPASPQARSVIARHPQRGPLRMPGDPGIVAEIGHLEALAAGERVVLGEHGVVAIVDQLEELEVGTQGAGHGLEVIDQRQVDVTAAQAVLGVVGLGLDHAQLHLGMARLERRHGTGHQRRARALEGGQPQPSAAQARERRQLFLGVVEAGEYRVGVAHQRPARVGEPDPTRAAFEQGGSGLTFQRRHLL